MILDAVKSVSEVTRRKRKSQRERERRIFCTEREVNFFNVKSRIETVQRVLSERERERQRQIERKRREKEEEGRVVFLFTHT